MGNRRCDCDFYEERANGFDSIDAYCFLNLERMSRRYKGKPKWCPLKMENIEGKYLKRAIDFVLKHKDKETIASMYFRGDTEL